MKEIGSFIIVILLVIATGCTRGLVFNSNSPYSYMDFQTFPLIISISPGDGAIDVDTSSTITVVFSKELDKFTVSESSFILADSDYVPVKSDFSYPDLRTVVLTPRDQLLNLAEYNVLITTDIKDTDGNYLPSEKLWYFTTVSSGTVPDPVITPAPGTYEGPQTISIACLDQEAHIRFTTDGTDPSPSNGSIYFAPFTVSENTSNPIKAFAYRTGFSESSIASADYIIQAFRPTIDPPPGIYSFDPLVALDTQTPVANIMYTLDLSDPATSLTAFSYVGPFGVMGPGTVTVMAVAHSPDLSLIADSPVMTAVYTINYVQVAPPVFDPAPRTYTTDQSVTMASPTPGSVIVYTTDGTDPHSGGTVGGATVTLTVSDSMTINAFAYDSASLLSDSDTATGAYIIAPTIGIMAPDKGPNIQPVFVTITGTHFKSGVTAKLTRNVQPPIDAYNITLVDSQTITCYFDLTGRSKGKWTLVVTNPDFGTALKNEFRIY
jgi:hypothetical protein